MSGANAISGITLAGAFLSAGAAHAVGGEMATYLGTAAVAFATINVVGGYLVTDRMLAMFKSKSEGKK
jgi:NAD(P) transhydrogenase subunit alpha